MSPETVDDPVSWPIAEHWNTVGRCVLLLTAGKPSTSGGFLNRKAAVYRIQVVQRPLWSATASED